MQPLNLILAVQDHQLRQRRWQAMPAWILWVSFALFGALSSGSAVAGVADQLKEIEAGRILDKAEQYLDQAPRTVTADPAPRSQGTAHDFYSEGDYWWPDPGQPDGPYIRRDGETNPDNFVAHRHSMVALSDIVATLTSAFLLTRESRYVDQALKHLSAWFIDADTRMNPSLLYGQAIKGRHSGRSIGIIDTIHLVEVARAIEVLEREDMVPADTLAGLKGWFRTYLAWLNEHPYGQRERVHPNNHGVCWSMQAAAFARLTGDQDQLAWIRKQFREVYLREMMDQDGGFPAELARTKPYGYSLFVIDAMAGVAMLASTPEENLWTYALDDGRGMGRGLAFIAPYVEDKSTWPLPPDVLYWEEWPARHPALLFGGMILENPEWAGLYDRFEADPVTFETLRNLPIRHPLLWTDLVDHLRPQ
jgi:hypothetical protein